MKTSEADPSVGQLSTRGAVATKQDEILKMFFFPRKLLSSCVLLLSIVCVVFLWASIGDYSEEKSREVILRARERPRPKHHFLSDSRELQFEVSSAENEVSSAQNEGLSSAPLHRVAGAGKTTTNPTEEQGAPTFYRTSVVPK